MKSRKDKIKKHNLIITRADMGRTLVIMGQQEYNEKIMDFINSNRLTVAKGDPTKTYQSNIKKAHNKSESVINNNKKRQLTELNPEPPVLKAFMKLHTPHSPITPVVSYRQAPAYKVAEFIAKFLKN
jgi:hypothetical protein